MRGMFAWPHFEKFMPLWACFTLPLALVAARRPPDCSGVHFPPARKRMMRYRLRTLLIVLALGPPVWPR